MSTKSIHFIVLAVVGSLVANSAMAELVAYYPFNEGQGTTTADVTGNGNDGTFNGTVEWVDGYEGKGVRFDTGGDRIVIGPLSPSAETNAMTVAAWIVWEGEGNSIAHQGIVGKRLGWPTDGSTIKWFWETGPTGDLIFRADYNGGGASFGWGNGALGDYADEWTHVAVTWDDGAAIQYINGVEVSSGSVDFREAANDTPVTIGCVASDNTETFVGIIDEVQFHNVALTPEGLQGAMAGGAVTSTSSPVPPDTATDIRRDIVLSWSPGEYAASHDVYFGTDADTVAAADRDNPMDVLASQGQLETTYELTELLDYGQTYYWRVDEVNAPPDSTVYPGTVWSFTVEPAIYPVQNIVATASIPTAAGSGDPAVTVDESGLTDGMHGVVGETMWSGVAVEGETPWLQYDFDQVYKLVGIHIWNYNGLYEFILGFGVKDITIEYATEPNEWLPLGDYQLARAPNKATYAGELLDLEGLAARSIRILIHNTQSGGLQPGLSEIRFLHKPVVVREPQPAAGATEVDPEVVLGWRPGREATSHRVYLSSDQQAVSDGNAPADSVVGGTYTPEPLNLGTQYFWRVDEVNEAATPSVWAGPVWDFTTIEYRSIDGFETYTDDVGNQIFDYWADGFGVTENGSQVGHDVPPYAERRTVHSGSWAMPFYYVNTGGVTYSESVRTLSPPQNWTAYGADTVSLYFRGVPTAFLETPSGAILMNGTGEDIYNTVDQFRFAYKQLTGNGSITVRVDRIDDTDEYAKAGVMIRSGLGTVPLQAHMIVTPSGRTEWQYRATASANTTQVDTGVDTTPTPYWVRVTRQGNTITGQRSVDGQTWLPLTEGDAASSRVDLVLPEPVYIGLVVTSHAAGTPCGVEFSQVSTTGSVGAGWQLADIGADQVPGNGLDTLYVAVEDRSGRKLTLSHPDPYAVLIGEWTQWTIPLSDLTAAGVNVESIAKVYLGVGDRTKPSRNAAGLIYFDDFAYGRELE